MSGLASANLSGPGTKSVRDARAAVGSSDDMVSGSGVGVFNARTQGRQGVKKQGGLFSWRSGVLAPSFAAGSFQSIDGGLGRVRLT